MSKLIGEIDSMDRNMLELNINLPCEGATTFRSILFWEKDAVLVMGCYMDDKKYYVTQPDLDGNCLLRIPHAEIHGGLVYTEEETYQIMELEHIDNTLLSYAIG